MEYRRDRSIRAAYDEHFHAGREMPYTRVSLSERRGGDYSRPEEDYREFDYNGPRFYSNGAPRSYHGSDHRGYQDSAQFGSVRRNGPPSRREEGYQYYGGAREDSQGGRQMEFRPTSRAGPSPSPRGPAFCPAPRSLSVPEAADDSLMQAILNLDRGEEREQFRRKGAFPPQRERSPLRRDVPPSPHSRSGSSVSSRSYSPDKGKSLPLHKLGKSGKDRAPGQPVPASRDGSPQSSKVSLEKPGRPVDAPVLDPLRGRAEDLQDKPSDASDAPAPFEEIPALEGEQEDLGKDDVTKAKESLLERRSQAITAKAREIEQVFRQDCETFGMVVKMLVAKAPALEAALQAPLRENLGEIQQRCLEDLRHFISELDEVLQPEPSG